MNVYSLMDLVLPMRQILLALMKWRCLPAVTSMHTWLSLSIDHTKSNACTAQLEVGLIHSWGGAGGGGGAQSEHYTCQVLLDPKLSFVNAGGRVGGGLMLKP